MAKARAKSKTIVSEVTLSLSNREVETLYIMTQFVGGDPVKSRRKDSDSIRDALMSVARDIILDIDWPKYRQFIIDDTGGFSFRNDKDIK